MSDFDDLCCDRCGSQQIEHFQTEAGLWQNRCRECGRVSEYIPTRAEIATACQAIRDAREWQPLNDDDERWLRLADSVLSLGEDDLQDDTQDDGTVPANDVVPSIAQQPIRRAG